MEEDLVVKITYIHQHFTLPHEGGGSRPYEFARRMAADGHKVTMICGGSEALEIDVEGIKIRRLAVPYSNKMTVSERILSFARFMAAASFVAARTSADVVFASSTPLTVAIPGLVAKVIKRAPLVFEVRDLWPAIPIELGYLKNPVAIKVARMLEKVAYSSAASIVALSPGMRDGVLEVTPAKQIEVIPNACDFELFTYSDENVRAFREEKGWSEDEFIVVYAGGFGPIYEIDWSVQLAAALKEDNIRFVLIGEGASSDRVRKLALDLGLNPDELLPGRKSRSEVAQHYASADMVLSTVIRSPGLEAASINKVFDGMAAGKPVLFNHGGWLSTTVVDSAAGWQLDRTIETAAQQLRSIVSNPDALQEAGVNSDSLGRAQFERNKLYKKLMQQIKEAAGSTDGND